ncbi:uncharacterized protein RHIMIDRAFT_3321 [Rhizopus microsporus ATCC 52813]|uniref:DUF83 domain-containing protein n=1 Tax=Rhizopus microsporus ATCC 52813 TaxID=1340429 RepID=A0A2G4T7X0_RHIZD|nr:uncharacterized protein RHIMIDRAFT_3321 [Rhizopus microsporus ATCC 52813]PHZ17113.1 hypothetical protein RHIMIDRAFT_3321 [Rhizopus microsporus ATCC 52813]
MFKESGNIVPLFNVSTLSRNYYFNCEKNYYHLLSEGKKVDLSEKQPANQSTKGNFQGSSLKTLAEERGKKFEKKLYDELVEKNKIVDGKNGFKEALEKAGPDSYFYNQEFTVDDTFYTKVNEDGQVYKIATFRPDFVQVIDSKTNRKKIRIIDAKSSKKIEEIHKIQVVSYWFLIQHLTKRMNIDLDEEVGIWLPSDMENPKLFSVHSEIDEDKNHTILQKVEELYKTTLPNIIKSGKYKWELQKKCRNCDYYIQCKEGAKGTVKDLPYNNKERYELYAKHMPKDVEDIKDIEDLVGRMQKMCLDEQDVSRLNIRLEGYVNCRKPNKEPIFFGLPTTLVPNNVEYHIYVSFLNDDYTYYPYAFAFHISPSINLSEKLTYCLNESYYQKDDEQRKDAFCEITKRFINALHSILDHMNSSKNGLCLFYVYDNNEMYNIKNFLSELVSSQGKHLTSLESAEKEEIVKNATKCLVALFQDATLLDVPTLKEFPCLDNVKKNFMTERFVVIEQLLEQNVALPAQVYYEVSDAVKYMVDPKAVVPEFKKEWEDFSKKNTDGNQFARETKNKQLELLNQLHKVREKYWKLAINKTSSMPELFPLSCPDFKWPDTFSCNNQMLARILYFTKYKSLFEQRQCQEAPIADLDIICGYKSSKKPSSLVLSFKKRAYGVYTFDVVNTESKDAIEKRLEKLDYDKKNGYKYILVPDRYKDIVEAIKYTYGLETYEENWPRVTSVAIEKYTVNLKADRKFETLGEKFRLYKIYEGKNENNSFKNMLETIDEETKKSIDNLLRNPIKWSKEHPFDNINFNSSETKEPLGRFNLLRSQQEVVDSIMKERLQLIWGSDDVKREFLAQFINWYISNFVEYNQSKSLVIGVAANSNKSVLKLLQEVEEIKKQNKSAKWPYIIYAKKTYQKQVKGSEIKYTSDIENFSFTYHQKKVSVVGASFSNWEYVRKWKGFSNCRMMIIDDGSMAHVHDALLPLGCLSSTRCKLIVAGDINVSALKPQYAFLFFSLTCIIVQEKALFVWLLSKNYGWQQPTFIWLYSTMSNEKRE